MYIGLNIIREYSHVYTIVSERNLSHEPVYMCACVQWLCVHILCVHAVDIRKAPVYICPCSYAYTVCSWRWYQTEKHSVCRLDTRVNTFVFNKLPVTVTVTVPAVPLFLLMAFLVKFSIKTAFKNETVTVSIKTLNLSKARPYQDNNLVFNKSSVTLTNRYSQRPQRLCCAWITWH